MPTRISKETGEAMQKNSLGEVAWTGVKLLTVWFMVFVANWRCPEPKIYHNMYIYIYIISIHIAKLAAIPPPNLFWAK